MKESKLDAKCQEKLGAPDHRARILPALVFLTAAAVYLPTLANGYAFDDIVVVRDNTAIRNLANLPKIFSSSFTAGTQVELVPFYRPLVISSFALNYAVGGKEPFSYHLVNLLLHAANSVLVFLLLYEMVKSLRVSFCASILFAVHPVATEAVCPIVGRCDTLPLLFSLLFLFWYVRSWRRGTHFSDIVVSCLFLLCALLSKEHAIVMVALPPICDALFRDKQHWLRRLNQRIGTYCAFLSVVLVYLVMRYAAIGTVFIGKGISPHGNPLVMFAQPQRFFGAGKVFLLYLLRLMFPLQLSPDYSYNQIKIEEEFGIVSFVFLVVLFAVVCLLVYTYRKDRTAFFGLLFFAVTFSIVSNFLFQLQAIMAERFIYLPLIGFAVIIVCLLERMVRFAKSDSVRRAIIVTGMCIICSLCGIRTFLRTFDWRDNYTLFAAALKVSPESVKVHLCYGLELASRGEDEKALTHYNRVLSILSPHKDDWFQGLVTQTNIRISDSLRRLNRLNDIVEEQLSDLAQYFALVARSKKGEIGTEVVDKYVADKRLSGVYIEKIFASMGETYAEKGAFKEAEESFLNAIHVNKQFPDAYNGLATVYGKRLRYEDAERVAREGIKFAPENAFLHNTLGIILALRGNREEAIREFEEALRLDPGMLSASKNLERLKTGERK